MKSKLTNEETEAKQFTPMKKGKLSVIFYLMTYCLAWILFFISIQLAPIVEFPIYLLSPAIAAFIVIGITEKRSGINNLFKRFVPKKDIIMWLFISIAFSGLISFVCDIVMRLITRTPINYTTSTNPITIGILFITFIGAFGEELGWRGFLLPLLSQKYSSLISSLILGVLWGLWHSGDYGEGIGFLLFVISTIELSIMMTWLYNKSNKNWLTAVLFHGFFNLSNFYVETEINLQFRIVSVFIYAIPVLLLLIFSPVFNNKTVKPIK